MSVEYEVRFCCSYSRTNDTWRNNNNMLRFNNKLIAADYTREFEQLFGGRLSLGTVSSFHSIPIVRLIYIS